MSIFNKVLVWLGLVDKEVSKAVEVDKAAESVAKNAQTVAELVGSVDAQVVKAAATEVAKKTLEVTKEAAMQQSVQAIKKLASK